MAKIIAIVNQKGGVGKTTTCVNLAAAVKAAGKRVLLCDFDPQANATSGMGVDKTTSNGVYDALINGVDTAQLIVTTPYGDVLPSSKALAGAGVELASLPDRQFLLKAALRQVADNYDFIFIDCPPSLELLTLNALCAANTLLVPVQGEYYALEGVSDLMSTVRLVRRSLNPGLDIGDLVISRDVMYHDVDVAAFGYPLGKVPGTDTVAFPGDEVLIRHAWEAAEAEHPGHTRIARIASGDQFICEKEKKDRIISITGADCTEMEGAAIAHTAYRSGIPFVILRAISDKADDSADMDYPTFERIAAHRCANVTHRVARMLAGK